MRRLMPILLAAALAGCSGADAGDRGSSAPTGRETSRLATSSDAGATAASGHRDARPPAPPRPQALVTAETQNRLIAVNPRSGTVTKAVSVAADPEFVAATPSVAVVVSPAAGAVTLLRRPSLRPMRVLRGFQSPHIAEVAPGNRYAYVTDDASGELSVVRLRDGAVVDHVSVGAGAHHFAFSPDGRHVWVALGESARTIVVLDTSKLTRPRVVRRFDPGYTAHDLTFSPDGGRVWVTSSDSAEVGVFGANTRRLLFRLPGGAPPQHVAFEAGRAYVTSGYGNRIEAVDPTSGRLLRARRSPHGSFDLAAADGRVATSSLLRGALSIYSPALRLIRTVHVAPATRDVALSASTGR